MSPAAVRGFWRGTGSRPIARILGLLAVLQVFVLIGCSGQAIVPPVEVSSAPGSQRIPGHYAATVQTGAWLLKTTTDRSICNAWTFDTALDASYESGIRSALNSMLERVTFIPETLTPQQLKARGFDAQIIIGQGDANSTFIVPVYTITGTAQGNVDLSVTVSIRPAAGNASQETVSARGHGRAEIDRCSGAATAISAGARNALGTVTRGIVRSVQQRLDIREASNSPRPKPAPAAKGSARDDATEKPPAPQPAEPPAATSDTPVASLPAASVDRPEASPAQPRDTDQAQRDDSADKIPDNREVQIATIPRRDAPRGATPRDRDIGPLTPERAFQRGVDAIEGRDTRKSDEEAVRWFRTAADQGYAPAQNNLGYLYAEGRGVQRNDETAVQWYRRAAAQGYPPAQTSLAMMVQEGRGAPRSELQALVLYSAAAGQGYAPATANVAQLMAEGRGIARDEDTAAFLMATAGERPRKGSGIFVDGQ